ncbi:alginate lyase family protein [Microvirga sp. M2]|uniref:heparinase II/III family protein n=1 Tax=Microvirga sp. M2 TaxID=3073270 RepID=UPI0039C415B7
MNKIYKSLKLRAGVYYWYWQRASAMSPPEVLHRVSEQGRRFGWRLKRFGWRRFDAPDGNLEANRNLMAALASPVGADHIDLLTREVENIRARGVTLLGLEWPADALKTLSPDLWLQDPVTKKQWPGKQTFCFDINYRSASEHSDVKFVWELNRLQMLHPVAMLARIRGDRSDVAWIMKVITSWMQANPPFRGVNWSSGIELGLRMVSIAIIVACIGEYLTPDQRRQIRTFVAAHGFWLQHNPSLYSSANNHRVAEGLGLLLAAQLTPDLPESPRRYREAVSILQDAVQTQFFADGIGVEQSPSYTAFTLEMLAFAALVLKDEPEATRLNPASLVKPATALRCFLNEKGIPPNIGDNDETRVVSGPLGREPRYVSSIIAAVEGLSGSKEPPPPHDLHIRDLIFGSSNAFRFPETRLATFAAGGYTTYQESSPRRHIHLVFDHGPLGFGTIAAHGHADALALWLSVDGDPVLADCGTYLYYSIGPFRDVFRATGSHSTLQVGQDSQSETAGAFNWKRKAMGRISSSAHSGTAWEVEGEHDGYARRYGAVHRRRVSYDGDAIEIVDRLTGSFRDVDTCISYLLDSSVVPELRSDRTVVLRRRGSVLGRIIFSGPAAHTERISLSTVPFSPQFNRLTSTSRIDVRVNSRPSDTIKTRIEFT